MMKVELVMAWPRRHQAVSVELPENATLQQALEKAGWTQLENVDGYAIFGVNAEVSTVLREGDRIELLRPLQIDPKDARRRRASNSSSKTGGR
jgi:putative ubiquitin-RnfH superfamily antitoxin RatB of RatAB toxin-antitoxin module